ncbi:hypothetical protein B0H14DRAFT_2998805 [Mycena olivaceomarginata]|nr:hypothetical protein B0H14DRAFT_2998805 [Mycena olivaceomarginata]
MRRGSMKTKKMGTALARASVSPGDLGVLAGAGVVGGERCVDTEVGAGGEDMQGGAGDQRIEVYVVGEHERGTLPETAHTYDIVFSDGREVCAASASGASPPARGRLRLASRALVLHRAGCASGSRPTSPSLRTHSARGTGVGDASLSRPKSVTSLLPLLPLLNDLTLIVFAHPRGFVIFIISLLPCPS